LYRCGEGARRQVQAACEQQRRPIRPVLLQCHSPLPSAAEQVILSHAGDIPRVTLNRPLHVHKGFRAHFNMPRSSAPCKAARRREFPISLRMLVARIEPSRSAVAAAVVPPCSRGLGPGYTASAFFTLMNRMHAESLRYVWRSVPIQPSFLRIVGPGLSFGFKSEGPSSGSARPPSARPRATPRRPAHPRTSPHRLATLHRTRCPHRTTSPPAACR
jgi:hypothetical protein